MMGIFFHRRVSRHVRSASTARFFRPLVEGLESRELLARNLTISLDDSKGVDLVSVAGVSTFTAVEDDANLNIERIDEEISNGNAVIVSSGATGTQAGHISTSGFTSHVFPDVVGARLTIQSGTGAGSSGADITLAGLQMPKESTLAVQANDAVALSDQFSAGTMTITAVNGPINMPSGGELGATTLNLIAGGNIGTNAQRLRTSVGQLTTNTAANNGDQFITEQDGLTQLNLNAGASGDVSLVVSIGAVFDSDTVTDITAQAANVTLNTGIARNFGTAANPIATSVDALAVNTEAGGSQFISESNGLTALNLIAGAGNVTLIVTAGSIFDSDAGLDIDAAAATITIGDATVQHFGAFTGPIATSVNNLSVSTAGGGSQFIAEANSMTVTNLDAGTGAVTLISGTFSLAAGNAIGDMSTLVVDSPAVVQLASAVDGIETVGGLAGTGTVVFPMDNLFQRLMVGGNNRNTTFSGSLTGNDVLALVNDALVKTGTGTLTLSGNNSFTGFYEVFAGKLLVTGSIGPGLGGVFAREAGTLGGTGTVDRNVAIDFGGHMAPGTSPGILNVGQALNMFPGSVLDVEITSAAVGGFDQVRAGVLFLNTFGSGVALHSSKVGNVTLQNGDELVIVRNDGGGPVDGTFAGLPEGANLGSNFLGTGLTAKITYVGGDGNDVVLLFSPGSLFPWFNQETPLDSVGGIGVQPDGSVDPGDALAVINYINAFGPGPVPANAVLGLPFGFLDTDGDNNVSPGDALSVINAINSGLGGVQEAEGEGPRARSRLLDELIALLASDVTEAAGRRRRG